MADYNLEKLYNDLLKKKTLDKEISYTSSLLQEKNLLAKNLLPIGFDKKKNVEFFKHKQLKIFGVMFHPEREKKKNNLELLIKKILNNR